MVVTINMKNDESSPRRMFFQNSFRIPPIADAMPIIDDNGVPVQNPSWDNHMQTMDAAIDSMINSNRYVFNMLRKLEIKFDRISDSVGIHEDTQMDDMRTVINKLNAINRDISRFAKNNDKMICPSESGHANKKLRDVGSILDQVRTSVRKSEQTLENVVETTRTIDERTLRMFDASSRQRWLRKTLSDD